mmetsp:Transcript_85205/g.198100  ORF Transcript_85205/g.198100 Transcript_85205/m.198100 type:complete len:181 (+) Transcript_85205:155-697(+)
MKRLALDKAILPRVGGSTELPAEFRSSEEPKVAELTMEERYASFRRFDKAHPEMQWRETMDHSVRRLMQDMELARDDRLKASADKVRCKHLDKMHEWFEKHSMKETKKPKLAPPYVRYNLGGPVMPGSLRVAPKTREQSWVPMGTRPEHGLGHTASLPSLTGTATMLENTMYPPPKASFG